MVKGDYGKGAITKLRTTVYVSNLARIGAKICQNAFRTIPKILFFDAKKIFFAKIFGSKILFSQILRGFGRRTAKRTAPSARASNFALDVFLPRSVQPEFHPITSCTVPSASTCPPWEPPHVLRGNQEIFRLEHRRCLDSNTGHLLIRTREMF